MDSESFFLPQITIDHRSPFNSKLFKILFFIPEILFYTSMCFFSFPIDIPEIYLSKLDLKCANPFNKRGIVCSIKKQNKILILNLVGSTIGWNWMIKTYDMTMRESDYLYFSHNTYENTASIVSDDDFLTENIYTIAEYFIGPDCRRTMDTSIYKIQKHIFIKKFCDTYLLINTIECFSTVRYLIIHFLILKEETENNSHIKKSIFD